MGTGAIVDAGENGVNKKTRYFYLHLVHGILLVMLLITGAFLYVPSLRTFLGEIRWEFRYAHSLIGIGYFLFLCAALPDVVRYARNHKAWQKTFHFCLQISLGIGWTISGIYLWVNATSYLSVRQFFLQIHDMLSVFVIPWILGHIGLWYWWRCKSIRPQKKRVPEEGERDRGIQLSRRDVLRLFGGVFLAVVAGGLFRWYQPLSERFASTLASVKRKGYFRIYSVRSDNPVFNRATWQLTVDGLVERPSSFSYEELLSMRAHTFISDFHCVTGWSVTDVKWKGVSVKEIIEQVKPKEGGTYVRMYSADQLYTETYELTQLLEENVILAYELEGKPLNENQGAPLRLFHPGMYGYKSIKWVHRIEIRKERGLGYWEEKEGYDLNGYLT